MDAPNLDSLRQEIDAIDGDLHGLIRRRADAGRADHRLQAARRAGAAAGPRGAGHAPAPGDARGRLSRRRRLSHVARDDERLHADADAGRSRSPSAGRPTSRATGISRATISAARSRCVAYESPAQVLAEVRANPTTIGVVPAPIEADTAPWWPLLAGGDADPAQRGGPPALPGHAQCPRARHLGPGAGPHRARGQRRGSRPDLGRGRRRASAATASPAPWPRPACPPSPRRWTRLWPACITTSLELPGVIADGDPRLRALETALGLEPRPRRRDRRLCRSRRPRGPDRLSTGDWP